MDSDTQAIISELFILDYHLSECITNNLKYFIRDSVHSHIDSYYSIICDSMFSF